jgi:hypothetical protein
MVESTSIYAQIEALHHLFAINQEAAAAECETLDRGLMQNPEWRHALAISLREMAATGWLEGTTLVEALLIPLQLRSKRGEAGSIEREVCDVVELAERYPLSAGLARAQCLMGYVYQSQGHRDNALACFRKSQVIFEQLVREDPSNTAWQYDLAVAKKLIQDVEDEGDTGDSETLARMPPIASRRGRRKPNSVREQRGRKDGFLDNLLRTNDKVKAARLIEIRLIPYRGNSKRNAIALVKKFIATKRPSPPCVFKLTPFVGEPILLYWDGGIFFFLKRGEFIASNLNSSTDISKVPYTNTAPHTQP